MTWLWQVSSCHTELYPIVLQVNDHKFFFSILQVVHIIWPSKTVHISVNLSWQLNYEVLRQVFSNANHQALTLQTLLGLQMFVSDD